MITTSKAEGSTYTIILGLVVLGALLLIFVPELIGSRENIPQPPSCNSTLIEGKCVPVGEPCGEGYEENPVDLVELCPAEYRCCKKTDTP